MSPAGRPQVSLLAVNWNGGADCRAMLEGVRAQTRRPDQVVVVDNGSQDGSRQWLSAQGDVELLANPGNLGFARAVNQGLELCRGDYVVLCNLDVVLDQGFIAAALERAESDPNIGSVGGRLRRPGEGPPLLDSTGHCLHRSGWVLNRDQGAPDDGRRGRAGEVFGVSAAAALYRRRMLLDVALSGEVLCADLFAYLEDVDLDWRARWRGWQAWYEPLAQASHRRGGTGLQATQEIERRIVANRITVWVRNAPPGWLRGMELPSAIALFALRVVLAASRHPVAAGGALDALGRLRRSRAERTQIMARRRVDAEDLVRWARPTPWMRLLRGRG